MGTARVRVGVRVNVRVQDSISVTVRATVRARVSVGVRDQSEGTGLTFIFLNAARVGARVRVEALL